VYALRRPSAARIARLKISAARVARRHERDVVIARMKLAGWWAIDTECGGMADPPVDKGGLLNAVPGTDPGDAAFYNGDEPLDARIDFVRKLDLMYRRSWDRPVTDVELADILKVPVWAHEGEKNWPMNQWVDRASEYMGVPNSVVLILPQDSLDDAERLWREYENAIHQTEHPEQYGPDFPPPEDPGAALEQFLSHIESAFTLNFADASKFVQETPGDRISDWAKRA
jgi:hypothetical protein